MIRKGSSSFPVFLLFTVSCAVIVLLPGSDARAYTPKCPARPSDTAGFHAQARTMYVKGVTLFKSADYDGALRMFMCTELLIPARRTRYWIGRAAAASGRLRLALTTYRQLIKNPPKLVKPAVLRQWIRALEKKIAARKPVVLKPRVGRPGLTRPPGPPVGPEPGTPAPRRSNWKRILAWTSVGVGVVLMATSAGLFGVAEADKSKIEKAGTGSWWEPGLKDRYDRRKALLAGSGVTLGLGAAAVAAGIVLFFVGKKKEKQRTVGVVPTRGGAFVGVRIGY